MNKSKENYIKQYNKENYKMYQFRIRKSDIELINKLDNVPNRNNYISNLISNDINPRILTIKQIKERIKPIIQKHKISDVYEKIETEKRNNRLYKIKRGLYVNEKTSNLFYIANNIYSPSYVSFETALAFYQNTWRILLPL